MEWVVWSGSIKLGIGRLTIEFIGTAIGVKDVKPFVN
jgi:hypothetical protein